MLQADEQVCVTPERSKPGGFSSLLSSLLVTRTNSLISQVFRFMVTGALATLGDASTLYFLTSKIGWDYRLSAVPGFIVGSIISYGISVRWVFASRNISNKTLEFVAFVIIGLIGLGLTVLIMNVTHEYLHLHYMLGKAAAIVIVFGWNFGARRLLMFR